MVNFTLSIPEELKAEMDKFPDVNWSELTRKSIQAYLQNRKHYFPPLDFEIKGVHINYTKDLKKPSMHLTFKTTNKLDSELIIDRIFFRVEFTQQPIECGREKIEGVFEDHSLNYEKISPGEDSIEIMFYPQVDMIRYLNDKLEKTFSVWVILQAYVQGFASTKIEVMPSRVPIDEWKNQMKAALNSYDTDWNKIRSSK